MVPDVSLLAFGFGNLLMLGWLAAAAAPILIHLWNKRRYREVSWAAIEYLLAAMRKNSRRMRLEQLLLLAVRTLLILLLVLALAQPYLEQAGLPFVPGQRTLKVFVIDGSYSMAYKPTDKSRFERAKQLAAQIVDESSQGDAFTLVLMASPPAVVVGTPAVEPGDFIEEIENLKLRHGGADFATVLRQIVSSECDADRMDYLQRDSFYSALAAGGARAFLAAVRGFTGYGSMMDMTQSEYLVPYGRAKGQRLKILLSSNGVSTIGAQRSLDVATSYAEAFYDGFFSGVNFWMWQDTPVTSNKQGARAGSSSVINLDMAQFGTGSNGIRNLFGWRYLKYCVTPVVTYNTLAGRTLATGFNYRFYPSFRLARDLLDRGVIGALDHIRSYGGYSATSHNQPWVHDAATVGGGALRDIGIHLIDLTRDFLGDVASVQGVATGRVWNYPGCEDNGFAILRNRQGNVATVHASWTEWRRYQFRVEIYGTRGCIRATCFPMMTQVVWAPETGGRTQSKTDWFPRWALGEKLRSYRWVVVESFVQEFAAFAAAVATALASQGASLIVLRAPRRPLTPSV